MWSHFYMLKIMSLIIKLDVRVLLFTHQLPPTFSKYTAHTDICPVPWIPQIPLSYLSCNPQGFKTLPDPESNFFLLLEAENLFLGEIL